MITTDDLQFFATLVGARSLAAAARDLNVSPSAVTQRLRALEARLAVHLIDRSGRGLVLTDDGEMLAERGRELLSRLGDLEDALAERRGEVLGHLRVVAPLGFGRRYVAPTVAAFHARHAKASIDLVLSDDLGRVPGGSWDIAIHVGETESAAASLMMRRLAANQRFACAAPAYLASHGEPVTPEELEAHACIALRENHEDVTLWRFRPVAGGPEARVRIRPQLASNDGEVVRDWAIAGHGIIVRSEWDVADDLRAGRLVRLLKEQVIPDAPVVALMGSRPQARASRTARFLEALAGALNPVPWRSTDR